MKIKLTVSGRISTGRLVSFVAPCGADTAECLTIGGVDYMICNAAGTNAAGTNAWASGAIVSVILNVEKHKAYIQNADTNAYLDGKLAEKYSPDNKPKPEDIGASANGHKHTKSEVTDFPTSMTPTAHNHSASEINSGTFGSDRLPTVPVAKGGTGATTAEAARTNLGLTTENWTFTLEDGSTVTKAVYVG